MGQDPVVETPPGAHEHFETTKRALELRIRQQKILADLGVLALRGIPFEELSQHTCRLVAEGIGAEFSKVLEYLPAENRFLVRAGVGWTEGVVGKATIGADSESPAGFALRSGRPVISNHLEQEERFRTPELLLEHGIHRAANVILQGDQSPYGVLEVDSRSRDEFTEQDLSFLQGAANILGTAIERQRFERHLEQANARQKVLLREINHRVKNSLQLVVSILSLQASSSSNPEVLHQLNEAARRISAIARVHQRLYQTDVVESVDMGLYVQDLCRDLHDSAPGCHISVATASGIRMPTDRAVSMGLLATELITNATKHAYPGSAEQRVWVKLEAGTDGMIVLAVRDEGQGLPADFRLEHSTGTGMRLVRAIAQQLNATIEVHRRRGTEFLVSIPADRAG